MSKTDLDIESLGIHWELGFGHWYFSTMAEVIPSINAPTFGEIQERISKVEPYVAWCHLDVTDGVFSKHPTWRNPADLPRLDTKLKAEVHFMVAEPEKVIEQWFVEPVKRVIVHLEAMRDPELVIEKCRAGGMEIGFAIRPGTSWESLKPWFAKIDIVCILRVPPGASGQKIDSEMLGEIRHIREACQKCIIEADGGINQETASRARDAGADTLVAGAYIFGSQDIKRALEMLRGSTS